MITIDLTDNEARIFRALAESNALDVKSGSVLIQFNTKGEILSVEVRRYNRLSTPPVDTPLTVVV